MPVAQDKVCVSTATACLETECVETLAHVLGRNRPPCFARPTRRVRHLYARALRGSSTVFFSVPLPPMPREERPKG